jgi:hypothetical protein
METAGSGSGRRAHRRTDRFPIERTLVPAEPDDEHLREARTFLALSPAEQAAQLRRESLAVAPPWKRPKRPRPDLERRGRPRKWVSSPLADWMIASKIRAEDLADRLGVDHSTVYRWLRGEQNPSLKTAQAIATLETRNK